MNSEFSPTPQEELEAQITALLLGELPEEEAAVLRERIAADPELRKLHMQIGMTIGLVKEAIASPQPAEIAAPEGLKLSEDRREKLLASFKVIKVVKVVGVPGREIRIDFRTWGALAAMVAALLSVSYWMTGAFSAKTRSLAQPAQRFAAVEDSDFGSSPPPTETSPSANFRSDARSLVGGRPLLAATAPATQSPSQVLTSRGASRESAPQEVRFSVADADTPSASETHDPTGLGILENPAPAGPKPEDATVNFGRYGGGIAGQTIAERGFYDQSAAGQTTAGAAKPTASNGTLAFGVVPATVTGLQHVFPDSEDVLLQTKNLWAQDGVITGGLVPDLNVAAVNGAVQVGGEIQIAQQELERSARNFDTLQLGERAIVMGDQGDAGTKAITDRLDQVSKGAEGKLATISGVQADRLQDLEQLKEAPAGSVTAGVEIRLQNDPLAFYRKNPELMKRYFPHLFRANEAQPQSQQLEGAVAGLPVTSEVEKLRRNVETKERLRDSVSMRILAEKVDANIPKGSAVQIVQPAEAKELTFWERVRGAERTAVVETRKDGPDIGSLLAQQQPLQYDPYFIQTEAEKVKSSAVLGDVVDKLNLSQEWGNKAGGQKLEKQKAIQQLQKMVNVEQNAAGLVEIKVKSKDSEEAARIANAVAEAYREKRSQGGARTSQREIAALEDELAKQESAVAKAKSELQRLESMSKVDPPVARVVTNAPIPQPEMAVDANPLSTFSLNVSDVSFKLAAASLEKGVMPEPAGIRSEEFINAFDYRDPAALSAPVAFAWERARYPFAHDRDLLRFSVKTGASGREAGRPLNLVLLLDSSGSMERADRVRIIQECLRVLAGQLQAQDKVSVVTFARTPRLWVDGLPGSSAGELVTRIRTVTPEGGTNLEEAMRVGYETAARHFVANGVNRVVLLTDGAANLGEVKAESLKQRVEENRKKGIALDCFGIGWEGLNDDLLEQLSRNGDGRYGFVNTPEAASAEFAGQLAGALKVAASDVKVQVEFNPKRAAAYRQIGYAKHQLTKEQFRDNTVDAAEIGAAEAGNALYVVQTNPAGEGPIATVRVRFKVPGTNDYREHEWPVPYEGAAKPIEHSNPSIRLAAAASGFSEWLAASPYAGEITPDWLLGIISNVPEAFPNDPRPKQLEWMIRQAKSIAGK